jgi:hypothetical protein
LLISKKITLISFPSSRALLNIFAIYRSYTPRHERGSNCQIMENYIHLLKT